MCLFPHLNAISSAVNFPWLPKRKTAPLAEGFAHKVKRSTLDSCALGTSVFSILFLNCRFLEILAFILCTTLLTKLYRFILNFLPSRAIPTYSHQIDTPYSCFMDTYLVPERKLGFLVQIKEGDPADGRINRRNTLSIWRIKIWVWGRYRRKRELRKKVAV